jgi:hypothetical protein
MKKKLFFSILFTIFYTFSLAQSERWIYRYNRPRNHEYANSLVYGLDGNIYTCGSSFINDTLSYFLVISLTLEGEERWVYQYRNGYAYSLIYGADGNIYVCGKSYERSSDTDFIIISLNNEGRERWIYRYNGPGNFWDCAYSLVYGADNNIYACGYSYGRSADFTVISVTNDGRERWVYRYDGPVHLYDYAYSIIYGEDGDIYACGSSLGNDYYFDVIVVCLSSNGNEKWIYRYNGPENYQDEAYSLVYGEDNNIYVCGYSWGSGTRSDIVVISLTPTGEERWVYRYDGPRNWYDEAFSLIFGKDCNIYVCGWSHGNNTGYDFIIISLTTTGEERWIYRYDGPGRFYDRAYSLVYGGDNNIYACGYSWATFSYRDFTVISLTSEGRERWRYRYNGPGNYYDWATAIIYGIDNNLYICGSSWGNDTTSDFIVISLPSQLGIAEIFSSKYLLKTKTAEILIYNSFGKLVKNLNFDIKEKFNNLIWGEKKFPKGVYFYYLKTKEGKISKKKIVKIK